MYLPAEPTQCYGTVYTEKTSFSLYTGDSTFFRNSTTSPPKHKLYDISNHEINEHFKQKQHLSAVLVRQEVWQQEAELPVSLLTAAASVALNTILWEKKKTPQTKR